MIKKILTDGTRPEYHEGMLIVKMRNTVSPMMSFNVAGGLAMSALGTPGLSALDTFERGGLIKRVIPLARRRTTETTGLGMLSAMATVAMAVEPAASTDSNAGVSILELERESDAQHLQNALASDPNVEFVSRVPIRYIELPTRGRERTSATSLDEKPPAGSGGATIAATPPDVAAMWNLKKILWNQARGLPGFKDANKVSVAVLDTGIDRSHPDLVGRVNKYIYEHPDMADASGERDLVGHGTHVSGTITAAINNSLGINGICDCQLNVWKIFTDQAQFASLQQGFEYFVDPTMYRRALADCYDEGIDVINLSIGGPGKPDPQEQQLFNKLLANGTTVVAAMGNERQQGSPTSYPAAIQDVVAVGATSLDDSVANFSNRGNHIVLSAPGVAIWSTLPTYPGQFGFQAVMGPAGKPIEGKPFSRETDYDAWAGTSMATPHVTAAVALLIARNGKMNAQQVRQELQKRVDKVEGMGGHDFHPDYGTGRLNLLKLLSP
jgi:hypothetical protein